MDAMQLLEFQSWAVVGATADEEKYGFKIYKKLKDKGYHVYPVSPKYQEIDGDKVYKTLDQLPQNPEVVCFVVNPKIGMSIVNDCDNLGIRYIWLQPGTVNDELLALAQEKGIEAVQACVLVTLNYK